MNFAKGQPDYWIYLAAYMAAKRGMTPVCHTDADYEEGELNTELEFIPQTEPDAEDYVIRKMTYEALSRDARFLIKIILRPPRAIATKLYSRKMNRNPTEAKLRKVLTEEYDWTLLRFNRVYKEVKRYVTTL